MRSREQSEKEKKIANAVQVLRRNDAWQIFRKEVLEVMLVTQSNLLMTPVEDVGSLFGVERAKGALQSLQGLLRFVDSIKERDDDDDESDAE